MAIWPSRFRFSTSSYDAPSRDWGLDDDCHRPDRKEDPGPRGRAVSGPATIIPPKFETKYGTPKKKLNPRPEGLAADLTGAALDAG